MKKSVSDQFKIAQMKCIKHCDIKSRNEDGSLDRCFVEEKEYLFTLDPKKNEMLTINEVGEIHSMSFVSSFTLEFFEQVKVDTVGEFELTDEEYQKHQSLYMEDFGYFEE